MLSWFDAKEAERFGKDLAAFVMQELAGAAGKKDAKYRARLDKVLGKAANKVQAFRAENAINVYKKSRLANTFLWSLKDAGCDESVAAELTDWLTLRL